MKKLLHIATILITLIMTPLYAQNGQNYYRYGDVNAKLNKRAITEIAKLEIRRLVIQNKIQDSWKTAPLKSVKISSKSNNWIVKFHNNKILKEKKQNLNIVIDGNGNVKGAGYSAN